MRWANVKNVLLIATIRVGAKVGDYVPFLMWRAVPAHSGRRDLQTGLNAKPTDLKWTFALRTFINLQNLR